MSSTNHGDGLIKPSLNPLALVISGPSGVGKDAILNRLKRRKYPFAFITTVTTRQKRASERNKVDYHFMAVAEFEALMQNDGLLEWANVYGNWYGVPRQPVKDALAEGKDTIIKVDVQGAANLKKILGEAVYIFIMPPSLQELSKRLTKRCTENPSDLSTRLNTAEVEMQQICNFDYIVMNPSDNIENAIQDIMAIVTAEKCRTQPRKIVI